MRFDQFRFNKSPEPGETILPVVDIRETDQEVVLEVDMPGADKDSLNIQLQGDQLQIKGAKKKDAMDGKYTAVHLERPGQAEYERAFQINADIDRQNIKAAFENGVLKIRLNRAAVAQPQKIMIS
ncbi:MAG: Hsp20/alpha crystallin family protein [Candidatus Omnitrophica bacterium]|nr:Hsp20/alpha crystallin family protein [Candidatus Omnitrophota bacterium]